jgi:hypothetical protein
VFAAIVVPSSTLAQTSTSVNILQLTPNGASPGTQVKVDGTISFSNSSYQIILGKTIVASGTSQGNYVNANFTVPELSTATYPLILRDVAVNVNATSQFTVITGYSVSPASLITQEGESIGLNVAVTGGQLGTSYGANIAVTIPSGTTYTSSVILGAPNVKGTASGQVTFPSSSFVPSDASTNYAGTYQVTFNQSLATGQFKVGILNAASYHRGETINIHAVGYQANQAATITVTNAIGTTIDTKPVTSSADGVIDAQWVVSDNAPIGELTLKIVTEGATKMQDQQTFTVIGYSVTIQVNNLSDRAIPGAIVQASDLTANTAINATTNSTGAATFKLEKGTYGLTAYLDGMNIGQTDISVTGDGTFTLRCQLTDMTIAVKTASGTAMPFVNLAIKYSYQIGTISRSGSTLGETGPDGTFTLASTLAGATYTIDASLYNQVFNAQNNTASSPSDQAASLVTIICPARNITLGVTGYDNQAIPQARIELVELSNGLFYSGTSDSTGVAEMQPTFGIYRVRVYKDNVLINQANLQVFNDSNRQMRCTLYGIALSVSVVDFFGSPIPNANVTLNGSAKISATTQGNGVATFDNIIGGNMQIIAQPHDIQDAAQAITVKVDEPTTVQIKIDKYISVGGMLMQATTLISLVIVLVAVLLFATVEFDRRRKRPKPAAIAAH